MDIQEQIKDLTEKFSNLFEVEGLGEPASDVPPSTNKIKKDVKTKDGKVELVSVEDELFPKDGNKREQFRQKVIDTINGMIQGTATLEDLLQVVRSKQTKVVKEGYEGVIEVLEQLLEEEEAKKERKNNKQHVYKRMDDPEKGKINVKKNYSRVIHNDSKSKDPFFDYVKINGTRYRVTGQGQIVEPLREGFEGVIEVLEELILELKDETKVSASKGRVNNFKNALKNLWRNQALGKKKDADTAKQNFNLAKEKLDKSNSLYNKSIKDANKKQEIVDYVHNTKKDLDNYANELKNKQEEIRKVQDEAIRAHNTAKYSDREKYPRYTKIGVPLKYPKYVGTNESLEGAIEILEELINEVSDELAKKASEESHNRYWNARTKHDSLKKILKNKGFFTDDELKDIKKDYKEAQKNLKKAEVVSVRDSKNQFNRDKRLGKLPEALELLEDIHTAIEKGAHEIKKPMLHAKAIMNYSNELQKAAKKELPKDKKNSFRAVNDKMNEIAKKRGISPVDNYVDGNKTDESFGGAFEGAIEILEDVVSMIRKQPIEDQSALLYKYHQAKHKENAGKDTYTLGREEEKRKSKEEKGQEKTEQRKKYRGKSTEDWKLGRLMDQIARNAKNLGKTKDPATAKAIRRNAQKESLKESMEILEQLLGGV